MKIYILSEGRYGNDITIPVNVFSTKEKAEKYETLKKRWEKVSEIFSEHKEYAEFFKPLPFNSGYFMCIETKVEAEKIEIQVEGAPR